MKGKHQKSSLPTRRQSSSAELPNLARALGWFSIGLGLAELMAPRRVAKFIGVDEKHTPVLQGVGARELVSGLGILSGRRPNGWMWLRVAGDVMDIAFLRSVARDAAPVNGQSKNVNTKVNAATAVVTGVALLDVMCSQSLRKEGASLDSDMIRVKESVIVKASPEDLYEFWRNFENLPDVMDHLESVEVYDTLRSHWVAKAPAGMHVEWDAEIIDDEPNRFISWQSLAEADVDNMGSVRFMPTGKRGETKVIVELEYRPPAGAIGAAVAKLFGEEPSQQIRDDLQCFKEVMENDGSFASYRNSIRRQRGVTRPAARSQSRSAMHTEISTEFLKGRAP